MQRYSIRRGPLYGSVILSVLTHKFKASRDEVPGTVAKAQSQKTPAENGERNLDLFDWLVRCVPAVAEDAKRKARGHNTELFLRFAGAN